MRKPVIETAPVSYSPVSEQELATGVEYAQKEYKKAIDKDLLRVLVNTTLEKKTRDPKVVLPFLAATVITQGVPLHNKEQAPKREAYKGAVMKILSERSAWKRRADARKRAQGLSVPARPKQTEHPEDPKAKGQLILL